MSNIKGCGDLNWPTARPSASMDIPLLSPDEQARRAGRFWSLSSWFQFIGALALLMLVAGCATESSSTSSSTATAPVPTSTAAPPALASQTNAAAAPTIAAPAEQRPKLPKGAAKPPAPFQGEGWQDLFDGQTLDGWAEIDFAGKGGVEITDGVVLLNMGDPFTGILYTNEVPKTNYEVAFDAMRVSGSDFFCGLTVPVGESHCSLICGGWGGSLFGISSIDGMDASENETSKFINFENGRWYRLRLRVTQNRIEGWLDDEKYIDVDLQDRRISVRPGDIELSKPFGISCWQTTSALREIRLRKVEGPADPKKKPL